MMIAANEVSAKARGGTELMAEGLSARLTDADDFQIVCSRVRDLDDSKFRIFWAHDLPGDPESDFLRHPGGHTKFHHYVFVSNWQMWAYVHHYKLPFDRCSVIPNAIEPIERHDKPDGQIRLIYYSTPHRGLELLVPVFKELYDKYGDKIHLDVYSSFQLYGWGQRDEPYKPLFEECIKHPGITYHGAVPNEVIREALKSSHILAYPSTWQETSCLVLIEAMSAGLHCVHSNLAALPETSGGLTQQYAFQPDPRRHAELFKEELELAILNYDHSDSLTISYANRVHSWTNVIRRWEDLVDKIRDREKKPGPISSDEMFTMKVNLNG